MRGPLILALAAALPVATIAPDQRSPLRVIGLVELPGVFVQNEDRDPALPARAGPVCVRVTAGRCREAVVKTLAEGWVPGYAASGKPTLWFYSRGC